MALLSRSLRRWIAAVAGVPCDTVIARCLRVIVAVWWPVTYMTFGRLHPFFFSSTAVYLDCISN